MSRPRAFGAPPTAQAPNAAAEVEVRAWALAEAWRRRAELGPHESRPLEEKIADRATLRRTLQLLRAPAADSSPPGAPPKVVFTNGCFDMLHPGHARYLAEARAEGDLLVVAMNDDAGIARLKGPGRPLLPLRERLKVMAALAVVDLVTWFDEETPVPLLRELRPDLLVKGGDYTVEQIVGHDVVAEWGGRAKVLSVSAGYSTSLLAQRMKS